MYQAGVEGILGVRLRGQALTLEPCIPATWPRYEVDLRHGTATYEIVVENPHGVSQGVASVDLDGEQLPHAASIPLRDDGARHQVRVVLGGPGTDR
jgi:cyclic beta-1,2-glucan synthetase